MLKNRTANANSVGLPTEQFRPIVKLIESGKCNPCDVITVEQLLRRDSQIGAAIFVRNHRLEYLKGLTHGFVDVG